MNLHRQSAARRRLWVWVVGSTTVLGYYLSQGVHAPRRTAVGVESPICGISDLSATVKESPSGRRWLLALTTRDDPSAAAGTPASPWPLAEPLREFQWPGRALTSRRLAPLQPTGSWQVEGTALRWQWDVAASGWDGDARLWARRETSEGTEVIMHPLNGGPAVLGGWPSLSDEFDDGSGGYEQNEWDPDLWSTLSSGLEELPSDFAGDWKYGHVVIGDRGVYLVHTLTARDDLVALYAVSDDPAPHILPLAPKARPLALSRDGRTLFFERGGVLWRLDLRKSLPALLDELSMPALPAPLAAR
jgi:hypothetical protein